MKLTQDTSLEQQCSFSKPALALLLPRWVARRIRLHGHWACVRHLLRGSFLKSPRVLGAGQIVPPFCPGKPLRPVLRIGLGALLAQLGHSATIASVVHVAVS
jgi:hypothetical protein